MPQKSLLPQGVQPMGEPKVRGYTCISEASKEGWKAHFL